MALSMIEKPDRKDPLTDIVEAIPELSEQPETPPGTYVDDDGSLITLGDKPKEGFILSLIRKASNRYKKTGNP